MEIVPYLHFSFSIFNFPFSTYSLMKLAFENRAFVLAILAAMPASIVAYILLGYSSWPPVLTWAVGVTITLCWLSAAWWFRKQLQYRLRTVSNLLAGLREGDYTTKGRGARPGDALGEILLEANALADTLHAERLGAVEATALLQTVMAEIDVAIFAFDDMKALRLVNRFGEKLLDAQAKELLGQSSSALGLDHCLAGEASRTFEHAFPGRWGRWGLRRSAFREGGVPHELLVLADLSRALRDEERQAWKRLLRVLGHELNNSLAPIKSITGSLPALIDREPKPDDWQEDLKSGLNTIESRMAALGRFVEAFGKFARLPEPRKEPLEIDALIDGVLKLHASIPVTLTRGPKITLTGDRDQLEQLLINLLKNAAEAVAEAAEPNIAISWRQEEGNAIMEIRDNGPGIAKATNLFVPFFTTKKGGSGIGLALSRQIAESHGGSLSLENLPEGGCVARLDLPV